MTFTETFVEDQKLINGEELILDVHVIAKPVPERVTWKLDDTELVDNKWVFSVIMVMKFNVKLDPILIKLHIQF